MNDFKKGDQVVVIDVSFNEAEINGSPSLFVNKKEFLHFGRVGHNKNEAIDSVIKHLENMKDE